MKKVWIWNHYATDMYKNQGGRHYWFAENLIKRGYDTTVFCANTYHNKSEFIDTKGQRYIKDRAGTVPFIFIKTPIYEGNGKQRIKNMFSFYKGLFKVSKKEAKLNGKPDIIVASSVHPLTLVAGIKIAKKMNIPCICEVRDLWPETIVASKILKKDSLISKILYKGEKWIYKKADSLIFTMEGGRQYIIDRNWDKKNNNEGINLSKVFHINNGTDLNKFKENRKLYKYKDKKLENEEVFNVVYTGSIGKADDVQKIVKVAELLKENYPNINFFIFGEGSEKNILEKYCIENKIENIFFMGFVQKKYIPSILQKSNLNLMHTDLNENIGKYGFSLNKSFDYLASGKPILLTNKVNYDYIEKTGSGLMLKENSVEKIIEGILYFYNLSEEDYKVYCENAIKTSKEYDFKVLTKKLEEIIKKGKNNEK